MVAVCATALVSIIGFGAAPVWADGASPSSYASMLNGERTSNGLPPLTFSGDLAAVAQRWSAQMASSGTLSHNPGLTSQVHNWQAVGENVGEGPTIEDLDKAFWDSPEHRANILDTDYREFGVGYTVRDGIIWIAVDFRQPLTTSNGGSTASSAYAPAAGGTAPTAAVPATSGLLMRGSIGGRVARIQRLLDVAHDGVFGPRTRHAVVRFQRQHRLVVDGVIGPETRRALRRFAHRARPSLHPRQVLEPTLQHALSSNGSL
jgi:hypothetical protein